MKCTSSWYEEPPYNEVNWDEVEEQEELEGRNWVLVANHPSSEPLYYPPGIDDDSGDDSAPF